MPYSVVNVHGSQRKVKSGSGSKERSRAVPQERGLYEHDPLRAADGAVDHSLGARHPRSDREPSQAAREPSQAFV